MNKDQTRNNLIILLNVLLVWFLLYISLLADIGIGTSKGRERSPNQANEDSLFIFWEDGSKVGIEVDLRIVMVTVGAMFFLSIFSTLMIFHTNGRENNG